MRLEILAFFYKILLKREKAYSISSSNIDASCGSTERIPTNSTASVVLSSGSLEYTLKNIIKTSNLSSQW